MHEFLKKVTKNVEKPSQEAIEQVLPEAEPRDTTIPEQQEALDMLSECRVRYRTPLLEADRKACKVALTKEFNELLTKVDDVLLTITKEQHFLHDHGQIFWGHLVQANNLLFRSDNEHTLPAAIIYSTDPHYDGDVVALRELAKELVIGKGAEPSNEVMRDFVNQLSREYEKILKRQLPMAFCEGRTIHYAWIFVQPNHLPSGNLASQWFPVIVSEKETEAVMILPSYFWPSQLLTYWRH